MLLKLEGFMYTSYLDLNIRYYHIESSLEAKNLFTNILLWGKYDNKKLPMGVCNISNIYQEKIYELFKSFNTVYAYMTY